MQIHELNNFNDALDSGAFLAVDNGADTGKVSAQKLLADVNEAIDTLDRTLGARIDNIIAGGTAPSAAEVTDARTGFNGLVYSSLGAAIRGQVDLLENNIDFITDTTILTFATSGFIRLSVSPVNLTPEVESSYRNLVVNCTPGDYFTLSGGSNGNGARMYAFIDANNEILEVADANITVANLVLKAPENAAKLVMNQYNTSPMTAIAGLKNVDSLYVDEAIIAASEPIDYEYTITDKYYNLASSPVSLTPTTNVDYDCFSVDCSEGDRFLINGDSYGGGARLYAFIDSDNNILSVADMNASANNVVVVAPAGSSKLLANRFNLAETLATVSKMPLYLTATAIKSMVDDVTSFSKVPGEEIHAYVDPLGSLVYEDGSFYALGIKFKVNDQLKYKLQPLGNYNRFIVYGSEIGTVWTEITRVPTASISGDDILYPDFTGYNFGYVFLYYDQYDSRYTIKLNTYESDALESFDAFTVNGVPVVISDDFGNIADDYDLKVKNIKLPTSSPAADTRNLCYVAGKTIHKKGNVPDCTGYLYFDDSTQKFYYSSATPDNPVFLFDWDSSLAGGEHCELWLPTITADGDIIFLRDHYKANPIIYPHEDYSTPYVVDFGSSRKPYGWLVGSSIVQFSDGSFVFGDYAYHSEQDELNNDGRIIWRVTKPYSNPANWVKEHTFKHVYFTHPQSDEPDNEIGHIHAIMYDFYADDLYCTTGDIDRHCRMWISSDKGQTWAAVPGAVGTTEDTTVQGEGQKWRMTNGVFLPDAMYWATDAQAPYHKLWKCDRDNSGHVDFSTLTEVANLEIPPLSGGDSQRTYITALMRSPFGLLLLDRGEPRSDKLDIKFYDFENEAVDIVGTFERATTDAGDLEQATRIGLPMECTTVYEPQCINGIVTGGGKIVRPNNTSLFNNSVANYVGALVLEVE